jgi:branched-chain amino acid transport system substrate-binding protein
MKVRSRYFTLAVLLLIVASLAVVVGACGGDTETTTTTAAGGGGTTVTTTGGGTATTGGGTATTAATTATTLGGKDKIVIGAARPISGGLSSFEEANFGPAYKVWVEDVNKDGGIFVAEYGKKLPVEMLVYDDQSDMDTSMRLLTKLIEEDKVDFVFAPTSTAFLFAAAGVANAKKYILMSAEGGATSLENEMSKGSFQVLNYSNHAQMPVFAELMKEQGAKTASIIYMDDLHGIEYQAQAAVFFSAAGIDIVDNVAVPGDIKDMTSIVQKIKANNPDIIASFCYPPQSMILIPTLQQLQVNPKCLLLGPGGASQWFYDMYAGALEGVMFEGAWSIHSSEKAAAYQARLKTFLGDKAANIDYWGALEYRAQLQAFQQAIEKAGTLNQDKIAEVLRTEKFETDMGLFFFDKNQILDASCYAGQIGQWQNGVAEVVDPGDKRTAEPIYPKPAWPAAAPK